MHQCIIITRLGRFRGRYGGLQLSPTDRRFFSSASSPQQNQSHPKIQDYVSKASLKLNISSLEDWYKVGASQFAKASGSRVLRSHYNGSLCKALQEVYPAHVWQEWKFKRIPTGYWNSLSNQKSFFASLGQSLGITDANLESWYQCSMETVEKAGGRGLIWLKYDGSLYLALKGVFPHHQWQPWLFHRTPRAFWKDAEQRKSFFDWFRTAHNMSSMEEWYDVQQQRVASAGGVALLAKYYNGSLATALMAIYPTHKWKPWRFTQVPRNCWDSLENQREYFDYVAEKLGIRSLNEWYHLQAKIGTSTELQGLWSLLSTKYDGSLQAALNKIYPNHNWVSHEFMRTSKYTS